MKKVLAPVLVLFIIFTSSCGNAGGRGNASNAASKPGTGEIVFNEYEHDFGKVSEGEKLSYTFSFSNKGTSDIILTSVSTTCGCTVPKYSTKPVAPGETGTVEVVFNTEGRSDRQTKTITVKSNAVTQVVLLKITADVNSNNK